MSFLKISGLVIGAGSVVGGTGAGIYYATNNKNTEAENIDDIANKKAKFDGKLVFKNKSIDGTSTDYEVKLLTQDKYLEEVKIFDSGKEETKKYVKVNKVVDISHELNVQQAEAKLQEIFGIETTLENVKTKVSSEKGNEIKELFGSDACENIKNIS